MYINFKLQFKILDMVIYVGPILFMRILSMHLAEFWKIYELLNFEIYKIYILHAYIHDIHISPEDLC